MRKTLSVLGASLAVLGVTVQSAYAEVEPECKNNNLTRGLYNADGPPYTKRTFKLWTIPDTANAYSEVVGNALICGSEDNLNKPDKYALGARVLYPNKGEYIKCARPEPVPLDLCDANKNGTLDPGENLEEGSFAGNATVDAYCFPNVSVCIIDHYTSGEYAENIVDHDTWSADDSDPVKDKVYGNNCVDTKTTRVVACMESRSKIMGTIDCNGDVVSEQNKTTKQYQLTIYMPWCTLGANPTALTAVESFKVCGYAGEAGARSCSDSTTHPERWQFKNGKVGTYRWTLVDQWNDMATRDTAITDVSWK